MARQFSNSEAKELISAFEQLLAGLEEASEAPERFRGNLVRNVEAARKGKVNSFLGSVHVRPVAGTSYYSVVDDLNAPTLLSFEPSDSSLLVDEDGQSHSISSCIKRVLGGLRLQLSGSKRTIEATSVVISACTDSAIAPLEQERTRILADLQMEIPPLLEDVRVGSGTVRWLFTSKDKKNDAVRSYLRLKSLLDGETCSRARSVLNDIALLDALPDETAWKWFSADEEHARSVIEKACPGVLGADAWPVSHAEVRSAFDSATLVLDTLEARGQRPRVFDENVKSAISRRLSKDLYQLLADVPVEELNRDKRGIRIKALKDAGWENVAQVCAATMGQLENIRGISWQGAADAKAVASELAEEARKGLKIRLSADDKSPEATEVVRAGYTLSLWMQLERERATLCASIGDRLRAVRSDLEPALKPLSWIFADEETKTRVEREYRSFGNYLSGDEVTSAREVLGGFDRLVGGKITDDMAWSAFEANPVLIINALEEVVPNVLGNDDLLFGLPEELAREIQDECFFPDGLLCTLRRYQEMGVKYILHQERTLLGDEMGLGKTVQAIAAMVSLKNTGETHFIVVCPASVLENWRREVKKHSRLRVCKVHGANAKSEFASWKKAGGVAVTTYETTSKLVDIEGFEYGLAVVDEAHYIKNSETARSRNTLNLLKGARRVCLMTGTALENKVDEMLTLIGYLRPSVADRAKPLAFMSGASKFRDEVASVYYRRKREDVLTELPELIESEEWCTLGPVEERAYEEAVLRKSLMAARRVSWNVENIAKDSSKAKRLLEIVEDAGDDGRKVLVFTFFLDTAYGVANLLGNRCVGVINGSVPPAKRQEVVESFDSAKAGSVLVAQIQSGGTGMNIQSASVVVFCEPQYKPSIENQAVSRAYRMGQTRNVLAYRLLCQETVDERILGIIRAKQAVFDAFADKSSAAAAAEDVSVDDASMGKIIEEEIERIKAKNPDLAAKVERERAESVDCPAEEPKRGEPAVNRDECSNGGEWGVSVTQRIRQVVQPRGGYINPRSLRVERLGDGMEALNPAENVSPALVGSAVDYLTRFALGASPRDAFHVSKLGARAVGETSLFKSLLHEITGLDDATIAAAVKLTGFDCAYRAGVTTYRPVGDINADSATIENIRNMVNRSLVFFNLYGPVTLDGFALEGGYTKRVATGDGDFLTKGALWDFKVSKNPVKKEHTLQLLMYWRMGLHSIHPEFADIRRLGIYNPRRNEVSTVEVEEIPADVIAAVERDVIGYR